MATRSKPTVKKAAEETVETTTSKAPPEEAADVGLFGSIKGKILMDGMDHLHPEDLAKFELFRIKKELAIAKQTILQKEEQIMLLNLRNKQQELENKKLEYQVKNRQISELHDEATTAINIATQDFAKFSNELAAAYDLTPEGLIYDDISGKLITVD